MQAKKLFLYDIDAKQGNVIHINRIPETDRFNVSMLNPEGNFVQEIGVVTEQKLIDAGYQTRRTIKEVIKKSRRSEVQFGFHYLEECERQERLAANRTKKEKYKEVKTEKFFDNLDDDQVEALREMLEGHIEGRC